MTKTSEIGQREDRIKAQATAIGFASVGLCDVTKPGPEADRLRAWIAEGYHGSMEWMETTLERRTAPRNMWGDAKTAIVLGMNYGPETDPMDNLDHADRGNISVYARGKDYHTVFKKRLKQLARWVLEVEGQGQVKVFVDTAPLMEKPLAMRAGLGWQGKHTNVVSRQWGSWLFLGVILTDLDLQEDAPEPDHCGSCRACLDVCPTNAFPQPYVMDARRCISYLTIEHKTAIPEEFYEAIGNRIYGCDDCLAICPWNKFAQVASEAGYHARVSLSMPPLADLIALDDAGFRALFTANPVKRIGYERFMRNVCIAIGNSGEAALRGKLTPFLTSENDGLAHAANWAYRRLGRVLPEC